METNHFAFNEIQEQGLSFLEKLLNSFIAYLPTLFLALILFIVGTIINKLVLKIVGKGLAKSRLDVTIHSFLSSLVKIVIYSLVLIIVLTILGIPKTSIITVIGSAGLAIGLAMQNSLSNVAGGVIVLAVKPFKSGDYVDINGTTGTVEEISVATTKLRTPDNKIIYLPNGVVSNATITNYNQQPTRRIEIVFGISYNNDFRKAIELIKMVAQNHAKVLSSPEPLVRVTALSASNVDIVTRVWVNSSDYWEVYYDMIELVKETFDEEGISIPYNQMDVHITNE